MKTVYAFDFDGTLTTADTLIEFVRYTKGDCLFAIGFLIYSPLILLMKLGILSNWKVKQSLFSWFFKGDSLEQFDDWCQTFARDHRQLLRTEGIALMDEVLEKGEKVLVISASVDNWVVPFFAHQAVKVLGTQLEVENGKLTGRFKSHNCYGKEKVNRLLEVYPQRSDYTLIAFGDSRGDKELLEFADEAHYKPFRK